MLYIKKIANKKYTIHSVDTSFAIFIDGVKTKSTFRSLKSAVNYLKTVAREEYIIKIVLKICIPIVGFGLAFLTVYWG